MSGSFGPEDRTATAAVYLCMPVEEWHHDEHFAIKAADECLVVYDIASVKRLPKALKVCRKYLNWVQKSVFEGELTKTQYLGLREELKAKINRKEDSVIFYQIRTPEVVDKVILGKEKNEITIFI